MLILQQNIRNAMQDKDKENEKKKHRIEIT
jgi:hypothetical protein